MSTPDANGWQPIETAPDEGEVIAFHPKRGVVVTQADGRWWRLCRGPKDIRSVTHWQPLPPPPIGEVK